MENVTVELGVVDENTCGKVEGGDNNDGKPVDVDDPEAAASPAEVVVRRKGKGRTYVWSLTSIPGMRTLVRTDEGERDAGSFNYTVAHSLDVAIGPLEYGGLAIPRKDINGHTIQ